VDGARRKRILEISTLFVVVVGLSVYGALAVVHHYDLANPYRDGTTHTATLDFADPSGGGGRCLEFWGASLGHYSWHPEATPPWGMQQVTGKLHIIDSQHAPPGQEPVSTDDRSAPNETTSKPHPDATFTARGRTIDLVGGRWTSGYSEMPCSIPMAK
jgi:hypothetical protein